MNFEARPIKEKSKAILLPLRVLGQDQKKRERKKIARTRKHKAKQNSLFSSLFLSAKLTLTQPKIENTPKKNQEQEESKNKGRINKEEGEGRKKGGQASHPTFNLITKIKSNPVQIFHFKVGVSKLDHKSYLNASLSMLD